MSDVDDFLIGRTRLETVRANLALLQRFEAELVSTHEGALYMGLLEEYSEKAVLFCWSRYGQKKEQP